MTIKKIPLLLVLFALSVTVISYGLGANGAISGNGGSVQSGGWLSGWQYRKAHNITGSTAGAQFNYQVMLNVHYDYGYDIGGEVYLNGKCRSDFGDVRFTDTTGGNLSYWIQQKVDAVQALFWVKIGYIPQSPAFTTIYVYYGNPNTTTASNRNWVFPLYSDFEDGTTQGWTISWGTFVTVNGVSTQSYEGVYSRVAGQDRGSGAAGNGDFYESFRNYVYLASGTYWFEGVARFTLHDSYQIPRGVKLLSDGVAIFSLSDPETVWHRLSGNFTLTESKITELDVEFHLFTSGLIGGDNPFYVDSVFVRKWCNPEPQHGMWSSEQASADNTPPEIASVVWTPTCPYPFVLSAEPRQREPVLVQANASDSESGMEAVYLSYRANGSQWWNTSMTYNVSSKLWTTVIPGQAANMTVEFFVTAYDNSGNLKASTTNSYAVKYLILGDENGDGICDLKDVFMVHKNYGKTSP